MSFFRQYALFFWIVLGFLILRKGHCNFGNWNWGGGKRIHAQGNVERDNRAATGFLRIASQVAADVELSQDSTFSVELEAARNVLDVVETVQDGETLKIRVKKGFSINGDDLRVRIRAPRYEGISLAGSGLIIGKTPFKTPKLDLSVAGSGTIELPNLETDALDVDLAGSGEVICNNGGAKQVSVSIAGSGDVKLENLPTNNANVAIAGSGDLRCQVTENLSVTISGSGDVHYKGTPRVSQRVSGSGKVTQTQ